VFGKKDLNSDLFKSAQKIAAQACGMFIISKNIKRITIFIRQKKSE